jgi:hypothetical protein
MLVQLFLDCLLKDDKQLPVPFVCMTKDTEFLKYAVIKVYGGCAKPDNPHPGWECTILKINKV